MFQKVSTFFKIGVLSIVCLGIIACQTVPTQTARGSDANVIAASIELAPPIPLFPQPVEQVFFVKLENDSLTSGGDPIPSNFRSGNRWYLLNAEPGVYIPIAALYTVSSGGSVGAVSVSSTVSHFVYFPEAMIEASLQNTENGQLTYMGNYTVKETRPNNLDSVQNHYFRQMHPDKDLDDIFSFTHIHGSTVVEILDDEDVFRAAATEDFQADPTWNFLFD